MPSCGSACASGAANCSIVRTHSKDGQRLADRPRFVFIRLPSETLASIHAEHAGRTHPSEHGDREASGEICDRLQRVLSRDLRSPVCAVVPLPTSSCVARVVAASASHAQGARPIGEDREFLARVSLKMRIPVRELRKPAAWACRQRDDATRCETNRCKCASVLHSST
jgi:hypothetical protein